MSKTSLEIFIKNLLNRQKLYIQNKKPLRNFLDNNFNTYNYIKEMRELLDSNITNILDTFPSFENINNTSVGLKVQLVTMLESTDFYKNSYKNNKAMFDKYKNKEEILDNYMELFLSNYSIIIKKVDTIYNDITNYIDQINKQITDSGVNLKFVKNLIFFAIPSIYLIISISYLVELPLNLYNNIDDSVLVSYKFINKPLTLLLQQLSYVYNIIISTVQFFLFSVPFYLNSESIFRLFRLDSSILSIVELFIGIININQLLFIYLIVYSILTYNVVRLFILKSHLFNVNFYNNGNRVYFKNCKNKKFYNIWTYIYEDES